MIRKARFRGSWYPYSANDNERITGTLDSSGDICMAVLPHAGLVYSGEIIKAFFEKIPLNTEKAVIISPSHYFHLPPGRIITSDFTSAETPFGNVAARRLQAEGTMIANDVIAAEHGLEMFLPFAGKRNLSVSFGVISSLCNPSEAAEIAASLIPFLDDRTILIASSDFTHYGKRFGYTPYESDALQKTIAHDRLCALLLAEGKGCEAYCCYHESTICGIAAASIAAEISRITGLSGSLGENSTSAELTGDEEDFVSYQSVLWRKDVQQ